LNIKLKVMERKLFLIVVGAMISLSGYSQNANRDSDRANYRDSVVNSESRRSDVREETDGSSDTTDLVVPGRNNSNADITTPSNATGAPGMTGAGNGAYDVDGKVNGKVDAGKKKRDEDESGPKP
jgi:hypothetical protein